MSPEAFTDWMTRLRSQCPCIIFDSSREALVAGLKAAPWLVKPNRRELEIWAGRKLPEMKDVIDAAHALREQGIAHVVISLGAEGALWVNASGEWIAKPPAVDVVSTVGAGDSMVGGLIYGLLMRESQRTYAASGDGGCRAGGQPEQCGYYRSSSVGRNDGARRLTTV
ncbi:1-phosphofructokinase [Salmonella enterica subsp. enterica]|nr:1-phosphofructokinase [Salmonella enterica subsp. enterica] [Salmonella enterica subsp. enterica serovar Menston]